MRLEVSFRVLNKNLDVDFSAKDKKLNAEFQCFQRITEQGDVDYYAFCGDKYYTMASWGNPTPKSMTISVDENGNITGLPALASGNLTIVRTP